MFKVGDWVRRKSEVYNKIDKIDSNWRLKYSTEKLKDSIKEDCELWQPQEGEWCWQSFTFEENGLDPEFSLHRFSSISNKALNYEPFIGELPNFIKDK